MDPKKKKIFSWALYDWANSTYSTTVMAGFFPVFFKSFWSQGADAVTTTARLGTAISVSSLIVALLSPTLGVIADLRGFKKLLCLVFMVVGVFSCAWMSFIPAGDWWSAIIAYGIAMMAFNASCVFYEALLPFVADVGDLDYASALGYSLGYLGGGILFLINVLMYLNPSWFGLRDGIQGVQVSFLSVALWWFVFSYPLAKNVPEPETVISKDSIWKLTAQSVRTLRVTFKELLHEKNLLTYMVAYWLYIDGVYTVMTMAVDFGMAIGLESKDLIAALLITQFIGFPCAYYFGTVTKRWGTKGPILFCIGIYGVTVIAATMMSQAWHFYLLAMVIGMVQGGVQALSRSLFARMAPKEQSGEYFGLFNLVGRFASILGPLVVAVGVTVTGNSRLGMVGLLILFISGGWLLAKVKEPRAAL
ncbi:MFS transporter [Bdellovibrio svalbardensis]|uniref:MFS transporter n=1 Tax=Bdellovibrio svalbardensis TaxID=2972972 RepID=A0ABT6DL42_9BACT|nr:MFS transporter [Bdellovibrio svalbardensis]MDG0817597.1 MFS transporter [Bdellovibrio svalbardensis]